MTRLTLRDLERFDAGACGTGVERRFCCPLCHGSRPKDASRRCLALETETGKWFCHRCHETGKLAEDEAVGRRERERRERHVVIERVREAPEARRPARGNCALSARRDWRAALRDVWPLESTFGHDYLLRRGISVELAHESGVRYCEAWNGQPSVVFPVRNAAGELVAAQGRRIDPKATPKAITCGNRNEGAFATKGALEASVVIVVEGPIDALSLAASGYPAVAVLGSSVPQWLIDKLSARRSLIALDADAAGDKGAEAAIGAAQRMAVDARRLRPPDGRDWNDLLLREGAEWLRDYVTAAIETEWPETAEAEIDASSLTLREFQHSGRCLTVWSDLLQEAVQFVADGVEADGDAVGYTVPELERIVGMDAETLLLIHDVKRSFGGRLIIEQ